jgi:hypothetical protein
VLPPCLVRGKQPTGQDDHLAQDHLDDRTAVAHRIVEYQDPFLGAGRLVDRIVPDATQHHGGQIVRRPNDLVVDDELAPLEEQVVLPLAQALDHCVLIVALGLGDTLRLDALLAQRVVEARIGLLEDEGLLEVVVEDARLWPFHATGA